MTNIRSQRQVLHPQGSFVAVLNVLVAILCLLLNPVATRPVTQQAVEQSNKGPLKMLPPVNDLERFGRRNGKWNNKAITWTGQDSLLEKEQSGNKNIRQESSYEMKGTKNWMVKDSVHVDQVTSGQLGGEFNSRRVLQRIKKMSRRDKHSNNYVRKKKKDEKKKELLQNENEWIRVLRGETKKKGINNPENDQKKNVRQKRESNYQDVRNNLSEDSRGKNGSEEEVRPENANNNSTGYGTSSPSPSSSSAPSSEPKHSKTKIIILSIFIPIGVLMCVAGLIGLIQEKVHECMRRRRMRRRKLEQEKNSMAALNGGDGREGVSGPKVDQPIQIKNTSSANEQVRKPEN